MNYNDKIIGEGLTFDDVLLVPQESNVLPIHVSLKTQLTKNIELNIPIVCDGYGYRSQSCHCFSS